MSTRRRTVEVHRAAHVTRTSEFIVDPYALLERLRIAAQLGEAAQHLGSHIQTPTARLPHLLLNEFKTGVVTALSKKTFAIANLVTTLHAKTFSVGIGLQHEERCVRRDDVELFRQPDDVVLHRSRLSLSEQMIEMASRPESRDERVPVFGFLEVDLGDVTHGLGPATTGDDDLARLIFTLWQIPSHQNLLHPRRDIWQSLGINSGDLHAFELDLQITQPRLCDLVEQLLRDGDASLLAADRANRAAAHRRDPFQDDRFADVADGDGME